MYGAVLTALMVADVVEGWRHWELLAGAPRRRLSLLVDADADWLSDTEWLPAVVL